MYRKETLKTLERKTTITLLITLSSMIFVLLGVYLNMLSTGAQNGYSLEIEKIRKKELYDNLQRLKTRIIEESTINNLEESIKLRKMIENIEKTYIKS
jgi:hypothetical protein